MWQAVRKKQPAPQPNYQAAQRQRVTIGITPVKGSANALTNLILRRGGKPVAPVDRVGGECAVDVRLSRVLPNNRRDA